MWIQHGKSARPADAKSAARPAYGRKMTIAARIVEGHRMVLVMAVAPARRGELGRERMHHVLQPHGLVGQPIDTFDRHVRDFRYQQMVLVTLRAEIDRHRFYRQAPA